jgi:tagatose 1,6-diphosphate aldolase
VDRRHKVNSTRWNVEFSEKILTLSPGKQKGLAAVADQRGTIAALAIDQRSAIRSLFSKASGQPPESVPADLIIRFKEAVSRILTPYASAILLDPEFGLPAAAQRAKGAGLLLAYEKTGYDKSVRGRFPKLLDGLSVRRLRQEGADCIKVLLYYSPFSTVEINSVKQDWVERVGAECAAADAPFFLELVSYHDDMDEKGAEFALIKPDSVIGSIKEFCKPRYRVDVLKVGVPVNMAFVESPNTASSAVLYSRKEAKAHFLRASEAATLPFIYLSEGVSNETFGFALELATEAGAQFSGVLCGRATWKDGVSVFVQHGFAALEDWLHVHGVRNIQNVNAGLAAAHPWFERYSVARSVLGKE